MPAPAFPSRSPGASAKRTGAKPAPARPSVSRGSPANHGIASRHEGDRQPALVTGPSDDEEQAGIRGAGDPGLVAGDDDVAITLLARTVIDQCRHRGNVGARPRFGSRDGGEDLSRGEPREPACTLGVRRDAREATGDAERMRACSEQDPAVVERGTEALVGVGAIEHGAPSSTVLGSDGESENTAFGKKRDTLLGRHEGRLRPHLPHRLMQRLLLRAPAELHAQPRRDIRRSSGRASRPRTHRQPDPRTCRGPCRAGSRAPCSARARW